MDIDICNVRVTVRCIWRVRIRERCVCKVMIIMCIRRLI